MTTNPTPEDHRVGSGRTRFVIVAVGIVVVAALVWMLVGFLNGEQDPGANASESTPMQTQAPETDTAAAKAATTPEPTGTATLPEASDKVSPPAISDEADSSTTTAAPVTKFEDAMSSDWPEGKTTGCNYVLDRLESIQGDVEASGVDGMRKWLDAIDDLQGDTSMLDHSPKFDEVKRVWSTALATAEESEDSGAEQALKEGTIAIQELKDGIDCK